VRACVGYPGVVLVVESPQVVVHALAADGHLKPLAHVLAVPHRPPHAFVLARLGAVGQELVGGGFGAVGGVAWHGGDVHGNVAEVQGTALMAYTNKLVGEKNAKLSQSSYHPFHLRTIGQEIRISQTKGE